MWKILLWKEWLFCYLIVNWREHTTVLLFLWNSKQSTKCCQSRDTKLNPSLEGNVANYCFFCQCVHPTFPYLSVWTPPTHRILSLNHLQSSFAGIFCVKVQGVSAIPRTEHTVVLISAAHGCQKSNCKEIRVCPLPFWNSQHLHRFLITPEAKVWSRPRFDRDLKK